MTRVVFKKGNLDQYLSLCKATMNMSLPQLAQTISVERHTLNDWRRSKKLPNLEKLTKLSTFTKIQLPKIIEIKPENWGGSVGAIHRQKLYGCTLTHADRVKAGTNSQQRRRENPDYFASMGCNIAQTYALPINQTRELAELVGILLGDGSIRLSQFTITLNSVEDKEYSSYVVNLIEKLFFYIPKVVIRTDYKILTITTSGTGIINYLLKQGLRTGDKVSQQVDVPNWIKNNAEFSRYCLRGLFDTDGCIFTHTYTTNTKSYSYVKANFNNASQPLILFVYQTLKNNGFSPSNKQPKRIWLYSQLETKRYLEIIGSSNERLLKKIR